MPITPADAARARFDRQVQRGVAGPEAADKVLIARYVEAAEEVFGVASSNVINAAGQGSVFEFRVEINEHEIWEASRIRSDGGNWAERNAATQEFVGNLRTAGYEVATDTFTPFNEDYPRRSIVITLPDAVGG